MGSRCEAETKGYVGERFTEHHWPVACVLRMPAKEPGPPTLLCTRLGPETPKPSMNCNDEGAEVILYLLQNPK